MKNIKIFASNQSQDNENDVFSRNTPIMTLNNQRVFLSTNNGFDPNISHLFYSEGANIEFLYTKEKISGEKLNDQIKTLFVPHTKKNLYNNVI